MPADENGGPPHARHIVIAQQVGAGLALLLALHAITIAYLGQYTNPGIIRAGVFFCAAAIVVCLRPLARMAPGSLAGAAALWLTDLALLANFAFAASLFIEQVENPNLLIVSYSEVQIVSAMVALLYLLELARRSFGVILPAVGVLTLAYAFFGDAAPGMLRHTGFSPEMVVETVWYGFQGVFGFAAGIVVLVVFIFVVFGAALEGTGAGALMIRLALWSTGRTRGGAGHAAIIASSVFGMSSGSVVANVVGTGTVTIPLIKRRGFSAPFAGGLEAAASSGGQLMPPVMGAAAFLMAQLTGESYGTICIAALLPALLYYFSLFVSVEKEAGRLGVEPLTAEQREVLQPGDALKSLMFFLPLAAVIATLAMGRSPAMAGFFAVITTILAGFALNPDLRANPLRMVKALAKGGAAGAEVMMAVGAIGILIGVFELTGLGLRFANEVAGVATSGLLAPLLLAAGACLILGMGMPSLPAYLIIVLVLGDSMKKLGAPPLAIHMFVFYFGVLSSITPPVAMASVAAAPIAGADPVRTSFAALRLAFTAFVVPFFFVFEPSILLVASEFSPLEFASAALRLVLAVWVLTAALSGFDRRPLSLPERAGLLAGGAALLFPILPLQGAGLCLSLALLVWVRSGRSTSPKIETT